MPLASYLAGCLPPPPRHRKWNWIAVECATHITQMLIISIKKGRECHKLFAFPSCKLTFQIRSTRPHLIIMAVCCFWMILIFMFQMLYANRIEKFREIERFRRNGLDWIESKLKWMENWREREREQEQKQRSALFGYSILDLFMSAHVLCCTIRCVCAIKSEAIWWQWWYIYINVCIDEMVQSVWIQKKDNKIIRCGMAWILRSVLIDNMSR